ncbi:MAG: DegT/DnrJ/EryC1/StrS family aminotransferase [Acidobacteria bacterium]|nr:DegT/DnrJ/EryC1/StrS family aminotransferase [Acidobacteriota bacterium]
MRLFRTLPPAAAPLDWRDLWRGAAGLVAPVRARHALARELRTQIGVGHVFLLSSGTAALTVALAGLRAFSGRTDVVIPAYTCYSVPAAVLKAKLQPRLCDIDPATFGFNPDRLEQAIDDRTLCVVAHHLFGIPSDVDRVRAICEARGAWVIEDAAQAMGGISRGRPLGTIGDAGIFSFGRGKNVTAGHGGAVVTRREWLAGGIARQFGRLETPSRGAEVRQLAAAALMALFVRPRLYWIPAAVPALELGQTIFPSDVRLQQMSGVGAGLLRRWLTRLDTSNRLRAAHGAALQAAAGQARRDPPVPYLRLPVLARDRSERERLLARSQALGLGMSGGYPAPVSRIPALRGRFDPAAYPAAEFVAERMVTVPTHRFVKRRDIQAISALLAGSEVCGPAGAPIAAGPHPM